MIIDTATEFWELVRLRHLGKLTKVMPQHYHICNQAYANYIHRARSAGVILILTHQVGEKYVMNKDKSGDVRTGVFERKGHNKTEHLVDVELRLDRPIIAEKGTGKVLSRVLKATVVKSRFDVEQHLGMEFVGDEVDFPTIAAVLTDTDDEGWR